MQDEQYMTLAIDQAARAKEKGNLPFGAVVVRGHEVISRGHSCEVSESDVTAHAEMQAVSLACRAIGRDLSKCVIYCSGEPCNMCASAILHAKVKRIIIGSSRSDLPQVFRQREIDIEKLAADSSYQPIIERGLFKEAATKLFDLVDSDSK